MTLTGITGATQLPSTGSTQKSRDDLQKAAVAIEAHFLSTLLKSAGLDARQGFMSGGVGEEQFASFLRDAQAQEMAKTGGLGLAQAIFEALTRDA